MSVFQNGTSVNLVRVWIHHHCLYLGMFKWLWELAAFYSEICKQIMHIRTFMTVPSIDMLENICNASSGLYVWPTCPARAAVSAMMIRILNTAEPTMVPTPTSLPKVTPRMDVNSSGAEDPAAMNVAPATSSDNSSFSEMTSRDGTKNSSHIRANPALQNAKKKEECSLRLSFLMFRLWYINQQQSNAPWRPLLPDTKPVVSALPVNDKFCSYYSWMQSKPSVSM